MTAFDDLATETLEFLWEADPATGARMGLHDRFDGRLPDWSAGALTTQATRLAELETRLAGAAPGDTDARIDRDQLLAEVRRLRIGMFDLDAPHVNPIAWQGPTDVSLYATRAYAPLEHRAEVTARHLEAIPAWLALARETLDAVLSPVLVRLAVAQFEGSATYVVDELPGSFDGLPDDAAVRLAHAGHRAADACRAFAEWLQVERAPHATADFALGPERFASLYQESELLAHVTPGEFAAMAQESLAANRAAFLAAAAALEPGADPAAVFEKHVASDHPGADRLVPDAAALLEELRTFVLERDIVAVPGEERCGVAATPAHLRWAFALMDTPGPFETATDSWYYVTLPDSAWPAADQEAWLTSFNRFALSNVSVHEAYPGHYVHYLHHRAAPTTVSRCLSSYAFEEGWALYTEEVLLDAGLGGGDPRYRLAQLSDALLRDARWMCAIGLHTQGWTVDEATRFFVDNAFISEVSARHEAERGTFDAGYFAYALGKRQIKELRAKAETQPGFTQRRFHDKLLSRGSPPVRLAEHFIG